MLEYVGALIQYGVNNQLFEKNDEIYIRNRVLSFLGISEYYEVKIEKEYELYEILEGLSQEAIKAGKLSNMTKTKEIWISALMDELTPKPSQIQNKFESLYQSSPREATDYFYKLSMDTNYIQRDRIKMDKKWKKKTSYGELDITINLSKPEKDPKEIAMAKLERSSSYPKCLLCKENEGYEGNMNHPARSQHRLIPLQLSDEEYYLQYSPYVYYNEHCIVLNKEHKPMKIDKKCFQSLLDFVDVLPHYFIGSNADLPIVGGSILSHDHFQGGK